MPTRMENCLKMSTNIVKNRLIYARSPKLAAGNDKNPIIQISAKNPTHNSKKPRATLILIKKY